MSKRAGAKWGSVKLNPFINLFGWSSWKTSRKLCSIDLIFFNFRLSPYYLFQTSTVGAKCLSGWWHGKIVEFLFNFCDQLKIRGPLGKWTFHSRNRRAIYGESTIKTLTKSIGMDLFWLWFYDWKRFECPWSL